MKIKELKEILNKYEDNLDIYLEFPARYKSIDADRVAIKNRVVDITSLVDTIADKKGIVFLTGEE